MTASESTATFFPAVRAHLGTRPYYVTTMSLRDIKDRISFAREIHKHEKLSSFIQRRLEKGRPEEIAGYLRTQPEHFFNALVVATYGGNPLWYDLGRLSSQDPDFDPELVPSETVEQLGFLSLSGDENLFAVDGQHRLAGIKKALNGDELSERLGAERVAVVMVSHEDTPAGLEQTRRLFTTLNKTARPVLKGDIIALDEDDVMAICTRRLIEESRMFAGNAVAIRLIANLAADDTESWTTIVVLYDLLGIMFRRLAKQLRPELVPKRAKDLKRVRPSDEKLATYYDFSLEVFRAMRGTFPELKEYFRTTGKARKRVVSKHRNAQGGSLLFRPIGQKIMLEVLVRLCASGYSLAKSLEYCAQLPRSLDAEPYVNLIWHPSEGRMITAAKNSALVRDVLAHQLGEPVRGGANSLRQRYRRALDEEKAELPPQLYES